MATIYGHHSPLPFLEKPKPRDEGDRKADNRGANRNLGRNYYPHYAQALRSLKTDRDRPGRGI